MNHTMGVDKTRQAERIGNNNNDNNNNTKIYNAHM